MSTDNTTVINFTVKECSSCGSSLSLDNFPKNGGRRCKPCVNVKQQQWRSENPEHCAAWRKKNYKRNIEKERVAALRRYGVTPAGYDAMLASQMGVCAICGNVERSGRNLSVDHNHTTGKVRGLLCASCNRGIGYFRDEPKYLRAGAEYIEHNDGG